MQVIEKQEIPGQGHNMTKKLCEVCTNNGKYNCFKKILESQYNEPITKEKYQLIQKELDDFEGLN